MTKTLEVIDPRAAPPVWAALRNEAEHTARTEPALASLVNAVILSNDNLGDALSYQLAHKLGDQELRAMSLRELAIQAYRTSPELVVTAEADLKAVYERDPACKGYVQPFLFFKGFQALQTQRIAHWLWGQGRETMAFYLQSRMSEIFQVDIHPATRIGSGVFIDHGTGIVIGETAVIGDDVSLLQGVTLGGTGAERGDRHPKIGRGVLLGAGAKVLGNIQIGDYAKIASGSVVLKPVPAHCTAAGVPARLVNCPTGDEPARSMDHTLADVVYDYVI
ncbi:MAG: serine O-acetyltransferase [Phenylobacterium sp.]|jgi:serine O-acetyltransferase|uniref:serine O-acetyltransferase n=1 Tax=Phenylobacterium sp. TaxID=1871053 RepID=UPI0025E28481|nr:serine O-acetyltransferase [Phenylobacterium sp.]MCA3710572.1 serine O-acetyltransferase [Phenylobacterium sp.]MCA3712839.1 serine O-acetyltransferase [Phenylobacterium sp.]MCA3739893.1 serine O-acetyltransferase [Phenylobacterium sp.]MCA3751590.1 serine O-acetyltransferase [Phenylobacterium sp.]MCA3755018.1 serine O-acetyltransferase [Phenylobacterium sp.]